MKIHKEGLATLLLVAALLIIINFACWYFIPQCNWFNYLLIAASVFFFGFFVQFFRNPDRKVVVNDKVILCPADGKVVVIEETIEDELLKDRRIQISIFMSPLNVHVNRNPVSGVAERMIYHPGKYLVAWHPKSSTQNERTTILYNTGKEKILMRQIAGKVARKIVWYLKEGQAVNQGDHMGFIKFGSRVDLFLPIGSDIKVKIGDVVRGGETIIAELK